MTNVYSLDGFTAFGLLFICTCAYIYRIPKLRELILSERKGFWGVFYKASVIGTRLHIPVAFACIVMGVYLLILK